MTLGVCVGRFSPLHLGHMQNLDELLRRHGQEHLVVLGSANSPMTERNLFTYEDRSTWLRRCYPKLRIAPLPDFNSDHDWLYALNDLVRLAQEYPDCPVFYGGCKEDLDIFSSRDYTTEVWDRSGPGRPNISATMVRKMMANEEDVRSYLDPRIHDDVVRTYGKRREQLRQQMLTISI